MSLISLLVVLVVVGVVLWFLETYVPMAAPLKTLIRVVVVLALLFWLLQLLFGVRLPRLG